MYINHKQTHKMSIAVTPLSISEIEDIKLVFKLTRNLYNPIKIIYPSGDYYKGETNNNYEKHGFGELLYTDGSVLALKWKNDSCNGKCVFMSYNNDIIYKGEYKNGLFHGQGKLTYSDNVYNGSFVAGKKSGFGYIHYNNGSSYIGNWKYDNFHGDGVLHYLDNLYSGIWNKGCQDKTGVIMTGSIMLH